MAENSAVLKTNSDMCFTVKPLIFWCGVFTCWGKKWRFAPFRVFFDPFLLARISRYIFWILEGTDQIFTPKNGDYFSKDIHISHIKSHGNWEKKTSSKPGENATRTLEILENDGQTFTNGCFNRMIQTLYMKNSWKSPFPSIFNGLLGVPGCYYRRVRLFLFCLEFDGFCGEFCRPTKALLGLCWKLPAKWVGFDWW